MDVHRVSSMKVLAIATMLAAVFVVCALPSALALERNHYAAFLALVDGSTSRATAPCYG